MTSLMTSSHDELWRAMLLSSLSTSRPRRIGWLHGEVDALDFRPAERVGLLRLLGLPREACFDGHSRRLACGASLPVAFDVVEDVMSAREARDEV